MFHRRRIAVSRRRTVAALLASAAALILSLGFAQASNAATPDGPFVIRNFGSGMCIQTDPANNGPDIQLVQEPCTGSPAQLWFFDPIGDGNYHLVNEGTFNCMRALANSDFAQVQTIDCTTISDEKWSLNGLNPPLTVPSRIISKISGGSRCLDVQNGSKAAGAKIDIFHCTSNNAAQVFTNS